MPASGCLVLVVVATTLEKLAALVGGTGQLERRRGSSIGVAGPAKTLAVSCERNPCRGRWISLEERGVGGVVGRLPQLEGSSAPFLCEAGQTGGVRVGFYLGHCARPAPSSVTLRFHAMCCCTAYSA